jgi:transposase InsO family protein
MDERTEFVIRASTGNEPMSLLCKEFGISRPTGYLWLNRYRSLGSISGLKELSRRPHVFPQKIPDDIERGVISLRREWGWGAKKLERLLRDKGIIVTISTINRIIKRNNLVLPKFSHSREFQRFERSRPNELWQMDFKGAFTTAKGKLYPLTILDDHSRFLIGLYALGSMRWEYVKACLLIAFKKYGLPDSMLMDHGSPWWGTGSEYGLSRLSVSLIKMGIKLVHSGFGHPQTQGKIERFHRTLSDEIRYRGYPRTVSAWPQMLSRIRHDYNFVRPHEALNFKVPADVYEKSSNEFNGYIPWAYPSPLTVVTVHGGGNIEFYGETFFVSRALINQKVGVKRAGNKVYIYFRDLLIREVDIKSREGVQLWVRSECKGCPDTKCKA